MPSIKAYNTETNKWEDFFGGGSSIIIESSIQSDWNETDPDSKAYIRNKPIINSNDEFEETDPTVPAWAKTPTKPTYTAEEIGAAAADMSNVDLNALAAAMGGAKIATGSYTGNGSTSPRVMSLVFPFAPAFVIIVGGSTKTDIALFATLNLPATDTSKGYMICANSQSSMGGHANYYAHFSNNTLVWYASGSNTIQPYTQMNENTIYKWVAIG